MQEDGNLELRKYKRGDWDDVIWASRTTGSGSHPYTLYLNENSNELEIHDKHDEIIWRSGVSIQNGNNFIIKFLDVSMCGVCKFCFALNWQRFLSVQEALKTL